VRELENVIARMIVLSRGDQLTVTDLPANLRSIAATAPTAPLALPEDGMSLEAWERNVLVAALRRFQGNQSSAARYLSITRKVLMNRIAKYRIAKAEMLGEPDDQPTDPSMIPNAKMPDKQAAVAKAAHKHAG
jgi:two-component system NtrC family response regulator